MSSNFNVDFFRRPAGRGTRIFVLIAAVLLAITGGAKLYAAGGSARVLDVHDPVFHLPLRHLLLTASALELAGVAACLAFRSKLWPVGVIAWLSTVFAAYRGGLWYLGSSKPCPCLGSLTKLLQLSPEAADRLTLSLLAFLLIGSYSILASRWFHTITDTVVSVDGARASGS